MSLNDRDSKYIEVLVQPSAVEEAALAAPISTPEARTTTRWELWAFYLYYVVCRFNMPRVKVS